MFRPLRYPGLVCIIALAVAGGAVAQQAPVAQPAPATQPPPSPRRACMPSAVSLCHKEVSAGDRNAVRACLIKNFDQVAPECQAAMRAAQAREAAGKPDSTPPKP